MGSIRVETVTQLSRRGYVVAVRCRCGNNRTFTPAMLMNMQVTRLFELDGRLRCKLCGQRSYDWHVTLPMEK